MAIKQPDGTYICSYCLKVFPQAGQADDCRDTHELVYVPLTKTDLNHLINFIYTKEDELLTDSLMRTLVKYSRSRNIGVKIS